MGRRGDARPRGGDSLVRDLSMHGVNRPAGPAEKAAGRSQSIRPAASRRKPLGTSPAHLPGGPGCRFKEPCVRQGPGLGGRPACCATDP